ncbi:beta-glucosidase [Edaphobacter aggregans]|uniref:Beta-glucosidase n=1 Tax=Edaphobacter aggregans TaxID=570835 RepID=A0A428MKF9_9BACT|nr:glycoside hydrolase family 3 C-terminal domain-containing protein [Edaphobacter aggregans]RSL17424.1 beta-glucosidase [Edaphobacter aggregans]
MLQRTYAQRAANVALSFLSAILLSAPCALAQSPQPDSPALRARVDAIVEKMTLEEKIDYIGGTGFAIRAVPRLNLPAFEMSDGPYGVRSNAGFPSTTYVSGIGLAATWNRNLAVQVGEGIGRDARARGVHYMLGPGVNIYRSPRNGRNFEYFGEDPFLAAAMTVGYINGMQSQGVSATVKHYMGNNSEFLRHDSDSIIDERTMREIYMPTFEAAVRKAHVGSIMNSYNMTNGQHMTQNGYLNIDVARKDWGFNGVMMSDWVATYDAVAAANGGLDLEMPTGKFMNRANLLPAIQSGKVTQATINEKVRNILGTAARFGWLDRKQTDSSISFFSAQNNTIALNAARESLVLLKNDGKLLPLDKARVKSILVVGPDAYPGVPVGGGSARVVPFHTVSALEGISAYVGSGVNVLYERGVPTLSEAARATDFVNEQQNGKPGLKMEIFANTDLSGAPVSTTVVQHIDSAGAGRDNNIDDPVVTAALSQRHQISRRWSGYYIASKAGRYIVVLQGAGEGTGNRVYVDDKLIIDNWKLVRAIQPHSTLELPAGVHKLVIEDWRHAPLGGRIRFAIVDANVIVSARAKELAAESDAVVVSAGFDFDSESEGGDRTFTLPFGQDELIRAMAAANKATVVTVTAGGNVDSSEWIDQVPAYLASWYSGQEGGTALAETLFGAVNPSGHLPVTLERKAEDNPTYANYYPEGDSNRVIYKEGIFVGYRGYEHNHTQPLYSFGYGLSYTTFKFSNLSIKPDAAHATVSFDITNTGDRAGADVAQVYVGDDHAKIARPAKELKGFEKVMLQPGETKHVSVDLDSRAFAYYDVEAKKWSIAPGKFSVLVGDSSASLDLKGTIDVSQAAANSATF